MKRRKRKVNAMGPESHNTLARGRYFMTFVTEPRAPILAKMQPDGSLQPTALGELILREFYQAEKYNPIVFDEIAIMPDHGHACFRVTDYLNKSILRHIENWLHFASLAAEKELGLTLDWHPGTYVFVAVNEEVYEEKCRYTRNNPLRARMEADASLYCKLQTVARPQLDPRLRWECYGYPYLLDEPLIYAVHVHRKEAENEAVIQQKLAEARRIAKADGVIAGGFISTAEKRIVHTILAEFPEVKIIHFSPRSVRCFKISNRLIKHYRERRWLEISSVQETVDERISYNVCSRHNTAAEALAAHCGLLLSYCLHNEQPHR